MGLSGCKVTIFSANYLIIKVTFEKGRQVLTLYNKYYKEKVVFSGKFSLSTYALSIKPHLLEYRMERWYALAHRQS